MFAAYIYGESMIKMYMFIYQLGGLYIEKNFAQGLLDVRTEAAGCSLCIRGWWQSFSLYGPTKADK